MVNEEQNDEDNSEGEKTNTPQQTAESAVIEISPVDMGRVRRSINNLVGNAANEIVNKMIDAAKRGQFASVKYLFEAVGLYPALEETKEKPLEDSLPYSLLKRIALSARPATGDDNLLPNSVTVSERQEEEDAVE
jgi:hypothetical protein